MVTELIGDVTTRCAYVWEGQACYLLPTYLPQLASRGE